jgi:prepilin-type processing-associated H-X9-DG protein
LLSITDGTSNTMLVGEKFISPKYYQPGNALKPDGSQSGYAFQWGDLNGYTAGTGWDQVRYGYWPPMQDNNFMWYDGCYDPTQSNHAKCSIGGVDMFGGPHPGGAQVVMCDGSVRVVSYSITGAMMQNLANKSDGNVIDWSQVN